jgi:putative heme-binding domain-containing protein
VVQACLAALKKLPASDSPREQAALVRLARRLGGDKRETPLRDAAIWLLRRNTSREFGYEFDRQSPQPEPIARWTAWLEEEYPAVAREYLEADSQTAGVLADQLEQVDWSTGDAARGEKLFVTRSCAACHQGRGAVGPDLAGVTRRFSREDIFTAIALPNRDVSSRYQTEAIETISGKTYTGLVVYDSVDGLTLRDGLNQTIRIEADELESRRTVNTSLMPAGLLNGFTPQDLADLFAYLGNL